MKNKWTKLGYLIGSLLLALLLSVYTLGKSDSYGSRADTASSDSTSFTGLTSQKTITLSMPVQLTGIDTNKYYITGVPEAVKIKLTGSAALIDAAKNTKNFSISADLTNLTDGEHSIRLKVSGLNRDIIYKLTTTKLNVAIYKRATANYTVKTSYNDDAIAEGYAVGTVTSSVTNVQIMGPEALVNSVARVVAVVNLPRDTKESSSHRVTLQALDANGNAVNVTIAPEVTTVKIPVSAGTGSKTIPVKFSTSNGEAENFDITASVNEVTITGKMDSLEKISSVSVPVDLSNITTTTTQTVTLSTPNGADSISPTTVTVTITPKEQTN
jgi:YbbR domain-containing protein